MAAVGSKGAAVGGKKCSREVRNSRGNIRRLVCFGAAHRGCAVGRRRLRPDRRDGLHDRGHRGRRGQEALEACTAQTGLTVERTGALCRARAAVPARGLDQRMPDIAYIDNSDVVAARRRRLPDAGRRHRHVARRLRAGAAGARQLRGQGLRRSLAQQHRRALLPQGHARGGRASQPPTTWAELTRRRPRS